MKRIQFAFWSTLAGLTILWSLSDTFWPQPPSYFRFRDVFLQYSGIVGIGVMSISLLLSTRPQWLERPFNGLDKMYRLHKWLGITALVSSLLHWWWVKGTKWMVGWGWLERPSRSAASINAAQEQTISALQGWLHSQRHSAEDMGEWAFYAVLVLLTLALIKRFPYRIFIKTHKWLALAYLALAYHTIVLVKWSYWNKPIGWILALLLLTGSISALLVLFKRVGKSRQVTGDIEHLTYLPTLKTLRVAINLKPGWKGHLPGQFAFVTFFTNERAHPYTISSAWNPQQPSLEFIIKALGDHTATLHERLKPGMTVKIEGPYGCFTFKDTPQRQIWIGGGIGITPFISRMKALVRQGCATPQVDLFYCTATLDPQVIAALQADVGHIRLHVVVSSRDGRLTGERIRAEVPDWQSASLWFCGPAAFGNALHQSMKDSGFSMQHFHQELFEMR